MDIAQHLFLFGEYIKPEEFIPLYPIRK